MLSVFGGISSGWLWKGSPEEKKSTRRIYRVFVLLNENRDAGTEFADMKNRMSLVEAADSRIVLQ